MNRDEIRKQATLLNELESIEEIIRFLREAQQYNTVKLITYPFAFHRVEKEERFNIMDNSFYKLMVQELIDDYEKKLKELNEKIAFEGGS